MQPRRTLLSMTAALALFWGVSRVFPPARVTPSDRPAQRDGDASEKCRWFALPLRVEGLPPHGEFVPVSCVLDFTALLARLEKAGAVDVHSLRLARLEVDGSEVAEPVQFSAAAQPRPKQRRLLPGAPASVSYLAEYPANQLGGAPRLAGELTWAARGDAKGVGRYRLRFGVPRAGFHVQVPYPPYDLRAFDQEGRATAMRSFPHMQIRPQRPLDGAVHLFADGQLATSYHTGPTAAQAGTALLRRPFLYPVNGPDGIALTGFGKPHDPTGSHDHHYSIWVAHAAVNGRDFWSEKGGVIVHQRFDLLEDGPVFCRVVQRTGWAFAGAELLHERRSLTVYRTPAAFRLMDVELELTPAGAGAVTFGKSSFGLLAVRVAQSLSVFDGGGEIRNEHGDRNERGAHLKRAGWLDQSGPVAPGKWGGVAVLDHPENVNHPTAWHCRNDGWAGAAFSLGGPYTLEPGQKLRLRYRIHLHRGDAATGAVARRYEEYRARPMVRAGQPSALE